MAWNKNGTPLTLSGTADDMDITDLTAKKFNVFLIHKLFSTDTRMDLNFNNNANAVYAQRQGYNGGSDTTSVSQTKHRVNLDGAADELHIIYTCSISGEEKLTIHSAMTNSTAGAGTAPARIEWAEKFVPSPDADITRIDLNKFGSGGFAISSNVSAIGTD